MCSFQPLVRRSTAVAELLSKRAITANRVVASSCKERGNIVRRNIGQLVLGTFEQVAFTESASYLFALSQSEGRVVNWLTPLVAGSETPSACFDDTL